MADVPPQAAGSPVLRPEQEMAWMARSRLPERHRATTAVVDGGWSDAFQTVRQIIRTHNGAVVVLVGERGTGKTQLATEIVRRFVTKALPRMNAAGARIPDTPALYTTAADLFRAVRAGMQDGGGGERQAISVYTTPLLLVVDEAQERGHTDFEDRTLTGIIDARYAALGRHTIIVGNFLASEAAKTLGKSVASRANECGGVVELSGRTFRGGA